jgi:hypothetical protein
MKDLVRRAILSVCFVTASVSCLAQSNVYSLGLSSGSFIPASHRPDEIMVGSYSYEAKDRSSRVEWYVSTNALAKQPRWDGLSAECPLSLRKASALALEHVRERFPTVQWWSLQSAQLRNPYPDGDRVHPGIWCYEIILTPRDPKDRSRVEDQASSFAGMEIILLDGTVVPLTVLKKK